jgi:hypothetical protein
MLLFSGQRAMPGIFPTQAFVVGHKKIVRQEGAITLFVTF